MSGTERVDTTLEAIRAILDGRAVIFGVNFVRPAEISNPAYEVFIGHTQIVSSKRRPGLLMGSDRPLPEGIPFESIDTRTALSGEGEQTR